MLIQVQIKGLTSASRLRNFAANKLNVALERFSYAIQDVTMRMHDINGPDRGGVDKLCRVVLRLKDNSILVIEDLGINMTEIIERVANRLHGTVEKQLSRFGRTGIHQRSLAAIAV